MADDIADVMEKAAQIIDAVNNVNRPETSDEVVKQIEFLRTLSRDSKRAARMDAGVATSLVLALQEWSWLARTDQDLMNRGGGAQMHQIARRIVFPEASDEK